MKLLLEEGKAALQRAEDNMSTLSDENSEMQKKANQSVYYLHLIFLTELLNSNENSAPEVC